MEAGKFVSIADDLLDKIVELVVRHKIVPSKYTADLCEIALCIEDPQSIDLPTNPEAADRLMGEMFADLERLIPIYVDLLNTSFADHGEENYSEGLNGVPTLLLSDGEMVFSLLQAAAIQLGIPHSGKVGQWYMILAALLDSQFAKNDAATRH